MKKFLLAIGFTVSVTAQAQSKTQYQIRVVPTEHQKESWLDGIQFVDNIGFGATVRIVSSADILPDKQSTFRIFILNRSDKPYTVGPENITIEYPSAKSIKVATYEELAGRLRRDIKRRQALAAIGGALSASSANGYTSGSMSYSGTTAYGTQFNGTAHYSGYDPALARQQQRALEERSERVNRAIQTRNLSGSQALESLIRRETIYPGGSTGGVVAYDAPSAFKKLGGSTPITIVVRTEGEEHRVSATLSQIP